MNHINKNPNRFEQKENPVTTRAIPDSPVHSPFPSLLDMVLEPFLIALSAHHRNIDKISNLEITSVASIQDSTYMYYYGSPYAIMADIRKEITNIIKGLETATSSDDSKSNHSSISSAEYVITLLLFRLSQKKKMIQAVILISDLDIWFRNLTWIVERYASWRQIDLQEYYYRLFCFQFSQLLDMWAAKDFASEDQICYVELILKWLNNPETILDASFLLPSQSTSE